MRVDKVILRAALSTVAAILGLIVFAICALAVIYPSTMMEITYDLGMDKLSIANAKQAYKRSGEIYYAAFAMEVAISIDDYERIEACGELMTGDDEFVSYCKDKDEKMNLGDAGSYEQYIYGQICLAVYRQGDEEQAVDKAFAYLDGSFPVNNALVTILVTAKVENDDTTVEYVETKMLEMQNGGTFSGNEYFNQTLAFAQGG